MGYRDVLLAEYDRQLRDPRTGPPLAGVAYEPDGPLLRKVGDFRGGVTSPSEMGVDGGYRYLQVDASEESRPILERLGFQAITTRTMYVWTP